MKARVWSKRTFRFLIFLLLILGLSTANSSAALQLFCQEDCSMHQPAKEVHPSCCEGGETTEVHHVGVTSPKQSSTHQPCCGGAHCFDAPEGMVSSVFHPTNDLQVTARQCPLGQQHESPAHSLVRSPFPDPFTETIPRYKRTCVYLI